MPRASGNTRRRRTAVFAALGYLSCATLGAPAPDLTRMVENVTAETWPEGKTPAGSGFIVGPSGQVFTNAHVITGCKNISVTSARDGVRPAIILGADNRLDAAVVVMEGLRTPAYLRFTMESAKPAADVTIAIRSVTSGEFQPVYGRLLGLTRVPPQGEFLHIDTMLQPGSSGAAVVDADGFAIGYVIGRLKDKPAVGLALPTRSIARFLAYFDLPAPLKRQGAGASPPSGASAKASHPLLEDAIVTVGCH